MFWDFFFNGLSLGAIFAFIALGYTMVYGIIKLINFAHGEFFMFGAFLAYFVLRDFGIEKLDLPQPIPILLAYFVALTVASFAAGGLAVATERIAYRPVRKAGRIAALITAVCVSLILQNLAVKAWGAAPRAYPDPKQWTDVEDLPETAAHNLWAVERFETNQGEKIEKQVRVVTEGEVIDKSALTAAGHTEVYRIVTLSPKLVRTLVILALVFWAPILWFLVMRTRMGKAMRAVSEDADAARLMGINLDRVVSYTFFLGAFVAGVGGVFYCMSYGKVEPMTGFLPGLKAFVAAVIGGIGSIPGAILGGLVLGVSESVIPFLLRDVFGWEEAFAWKDAIAFALLIVILVVKPTGLLGKPIREKV
ncbi:MAG: branched-chain amino acid ABC transporter permease [Planctomycetota bacterium]